ncbi:TRAP transporter large permease [Ancylobacter vacuolatus]|uniref:TRAP transporter large permease protein n=1 Tax=Ancylobacter vacuolatus TaxID=223389 RepID=A0ABU0DK80_9HYPH|nr:TRAP transporter large permease [Ancylobacter vacuolatus]MDQ0348718.1 tripartite ATP-independent transporter DctM subunit [Ancylobacter vacuolatus]
MTAVILIVLLVVMLAVGVPIAFSIGLLAVAGLTLAGISTPSIAAQRMFSGMNAYALLALPLFILGGNILVAGGVIQRLIAFADVMVGRIRGGLAQVNVLANLMMAGVSGSATADSAAIGAVMIPAMKERGYTADFAAALTISGAIMAPILPPSLIMVIYAIPTKLSIGAMFFAGILPAVLIALLLMGYVAFARRKDALIVPAQTGFRVYVKATITALPVLAAPLLIVGGVRGGMFTATEAAGILCGYAILLCAVAYRTVGLTKLIEVFRESAMTTATIMIIVATSNLFAWYLAMENVPNAARDLFQSLTDNPFVFLLLVNVFLLIVGAFVDTVPAILIFVPILQPTAVQFGIDPIHFAIVVIVNLMIGLNTPPVGTNLFVISSVAGRPMMAISRALLPFYGIKIVALLLITYVPALSLWLPRLAGLHN